MKTMKGLLIVAALFAAFVLFLAGCGGNSGTGDNVTVTFNSQGGSAVSSKTVTRGDPVAEPAAPTKNGSVFEGWYTSLGDAGVLWGFDDPVNSNMTLYAKWSGGTGSGEYDKVTLGKPIQGPSGSFFFAREGRIDNNEGAAQDVNVGKTGVTFADFVVAKYFVIKFTSTLDKISIGWSGDSGWDWYTKKVTINSGASPPAGAVWKAEEQELWLELSLFFSDYAQYVNAEYDMALIIYQWETGGNSDSSAHIADSWLLKPKN
ncbi:MAG: InlB B-repeat-containing protein [Treponema sp.]|jgi:uncharacterized repeat protein (TIGR02543 family)|nr:InlB B-repeat-containing protein [Treponema sp.]